MVMFQFAMCDSPKNLRSTWPFNKIGPPVWSKESHGSGNFDPPSNYDSKEELCGPLGEHMASAKGKDLQIGEVSSFRSMKMLTLVISCNL